MNQDIECVFEGFGGLGAIYISSYKAASNLELLQSKSDLMIELEVRAIISAARGSILAHSRYQIPYYLYIEAEDHDQYDITPHFDKTFQFIDEARKHTNVLVHCHAGISRSVTIVIAYLLRKYHQPLSQVFSTIRRKRRKVNQF